MATKFSSSQLNNEFDTVADMVANTKLNVGERVRTLGYTSIGDGGGNEYQIELLLNGVKTGATKTYNGTSTQVSFIASAGTKDYIADVGDTLEVQVKTNNGTPTPNDVVVEVYGFELT